VYRKIGWLGRGAGGPGMVASAAHRDSAYVEEFDLEVRRRVVHFGRSLQRPLEKFVLEDARPANQRIGLGMH